MLNKAEEKHHPNPRIAMPGEPKPARRIPITRQDVIELFDYLEDGLVSDACDHSFRYTEVFLASRNIESAPALIWIHQLGAACDCEILHNFELEWDEPL